MLCPQDSTVSHCFLNSKNRRMSKVTFFVLSCSKLSVMGKGDDVRQDGGKFEDEQVFNFYIYHYIYKIPSRNGGNL